MQKIFQRWGRVEEVFISGKLNRWGNRFGFVRFCDVKNITKLESELDSICIGSMKLYVNIPRYRKHEAHLPAPQMTEPPNSKQSNKQGKVVKQWRVKAGYQHNVQKNSKNGTVKDSEKDWKGPVISSEPLKLPWLEESWVGTMKDYMSMEVLREEMLHEGLGSIRVRYLGDNQVLLTGQDGVKLYDVLEASKDSLYKMFVLLKPWKESKVIGNKTVWARCRGLPLSLWTVDCFRKVLHKVGTLMEVDEATLNWERVEYARLKVRTTVASKVQICEEAWINKRVYQISVEEESSYLECGPSCRWYKEDDFSDVSSAAETKVANSIQSDDAGWEKLENERALKLALKVERRWINSDHQRFEEVKQRLSEVDQLFWAREQSLADDRDSRRISCMEMVGNVQTYPKTEPVKLEHRGTVLELKNCTDWVNTQRLDNKWEQSLSRVLFLFDVQWAYEKGAPNWVGPAGIGPNAQPRIRSGAGGGVTSDATDWLGAGVQGASWWSC